MAAWANADQISYLNPFTCIEICFKSPYMVCISKYSTYTWEQHVFCCWTKCSINANQVKLIKSIVEIHCIFDFLPTYSINYWEWYRNLQLYLWIYFSLEFSQFLLHVFWRSFIRYINIYDCYILLLNWPLCHYKITFLSVAVFFTLKAALSYINTAIPAFCRWV